MEGSPALEIPGAIRNHFSDKDHQDGTGADGQWWAMMFLAPWCLQPCAGSPACPGPAEGNPSKQESVLLLGFNFTEKWKVEKIIEPQLPSCLCLPWPLPLSLWVSVRKELGAWNVRNWPHFCQFWVSLWPQELCHFQRFEGIRPCWKEEFWKAAKFCRHGYMERSRKNYTTPCLCLSFFCTPHLYNVKNFLGLPGRIFASKRKSEQLSSQTVSGCLFLLINEVTHF